MVVKGVLNTVVHLLKVAFGEKKSIARKRSNPAGEFPERVMEEVISAFSGTCLLSPGKLWELNGSFLLTGSKRPTAEHKCDSRPTLPAVNCRIV